MKRLSAEELIAIAKRAAAATPGPWHTFGPEAISRWMVFDEGWCVAYTKTYTSDTEVFGGRPPPTYIDADANADFIAHARADIPALLAHIAALEGNRNANFRRT